MDGLQRIISTIAHLRETTDIEPARAIVFKAGQRRMFAENIGGACIGEGLPETQALGDFANDPPIRSRFARQWKKGTLTRNAPLGIGDDPVLLAPGGCWQQHMGAGVERVIGAQHFGDSEEIETTQRFARMIGLGQRHRRIGRHDPERANALLGNGVEHLHGLQALALRHHRRVPEALDAINLRWRKPHMRRQHIGEAARLAAAHSIGLPGEREGPRALLGNAPARHMAMDDGVDFICPLRRLVDALAPCGDHALRADPGIAEGVDQRGRKAATRRDGGKIGRDFARSLQGCVKA